MIDLENKEERNKLIDDFFNKGLECNIKEVYQAVVNTIADLEYVNDEKIKEIERLTELCNKYEEEHKTTFEEWKKTINIINELEKYIIDFKEDYEKNRFQPNAKVYIYWKDLVDKLQELKGSNGAIPPEVIGTNGEDGGLFDYGDSIFDSMCTDFSNINEEIEIIEEDKKIEKLREPLLQEETLNYVKLLKSKINEIIDYISKENK